jgi:hypothetical protein
MTENCFWRVIFIQWGLQDKAKQIGFGTMMVKKSLPCRQACVQMQICTGIYLFLKTTLKNPYLRAKK